jgi:hypothetical protein
MMIVMNDKKINSLDPALRQALGQASLEASRYNDELLNFTGMTVAGLKKWIDAKRPVIVSIQAWAEKSVNYPADWGDGHYVMAVGYDQENIYFMDPSLLGNYGYIPIGEFVKRWHDRDDEKVLDQFGIVISRGPPAYNPGKIKPIK